VFPSIKREPEKGTGSDQDDWCLSPFPAAQLVSPSHESGA